MEMQLFGSQGFERGKVELPKQLEAFFDGTLLKLLSIADQLLCRVENPDPRVDLAGKVIIDAYSMVQAAADAMKGEECQLNEATRNVEDLARVGEIVVAESNGDLNAQAELVMRELSGLTSKGVNPS